MAELQDVGGIDITGTALLSQEGRTIETAVEIVRAVVPEPHSLRLHLRYFVWGASPRVIAKNAMMLPS
jgi:hypothetical protein